MKRRLRKIAAILLIMVLASGFVFGAEVQIINPIPVSLLNGDSFLVSVKMTGAGTMRVMLYEAKEGKSDDLTSVAVDKLTDKQIEEIIKNITESNVPAGTEVSSSAKVEGAVSSEAKNSVFGGTETGTNAEDTKTTKRTVPAYTPVPVGEAVTYTSKEGIGFYTKQVNNVNPGIYGLRVELLDSAGKTESEVVSVFALKEKASEEAKDIFKEKQPTADHIIKKIIKRIFK